MRKVRSIGELESELAEARQRVQEARWLDETVEVIKKRVSGYHDAPPGVRIFLAKRLRELADEIAPTRRSGGRT